MGSRPGRPRFPGLRAGCGPGVCFLWCCMWPSCAERGVSGINANGDGSSGNGSRLPVTEKQPRRERESSSCERGERAASCEGGRERRRARGRRGRHPAREEEGDVRGAFGQPVSGATSIVVVARGASGVGERDMRRSRFGGCVLGGLGRWPRPQVGAQVWVGVEVGASGSTVKAGGGTDDDRRVAGDDERDSGVRGSASPTPVLETVTPKSVRAPGVGGAQGENAECESLGEVGGGWMLLRLSMWIFPSSILPTPTARRGAPRVDVLLTFRSVLYGHSPRMHIAPPFRMPTMPTLRSCFARPVPESPTHSRVR